MVMWVVELSYFNWFIGWLRRWGKEIPAARQAVDEFWKQGFGKEIAVLFPQMKALALRIWDWIHAFVQGRIQTSATKQDRWLARTVKGILKVRAVRPRFVGYRA